MGMRVRPVRLSAFTPGVWCQFAAEMSRFHVEARYQAAGKSMTYSKDIHVSRLTASFAGRELTIGLTELPEKSKLIDIALLTEELPVPLAQVEEALYAVVTRYVYDAFDRLRERPEAVFRIPSVAGSPLLQEPIWPASDAKLGGLPPSQQGRVRIVRVLRSKSTARGGFEPVVREFPEDFFGWSADGESALPDEPRDAAGQVLGISVPIEWSLTSVGGSS